MGGTAAGIIKLLCEKFSFMEGLGFTPEVAKVTDSKKVSDHHAIIPTMELAKADPDALPESEKNILTLAGARLLFATAEPHMKRLRRFSHALIRSLRRGERRSFLTGGKRLNTDTGRR